MTNFLFLLSGHWIADFVLQSDWMAQNKSNDANALTIHCGVYAFVMALFSYLVLGANNFFYIVLLFFISHMIVDGITSKINSYLWKNNQIHWFFTSVGFDQLIHFGIIYLILIIFSI